MSINTKWMSALARSWVRFHYPQGDITRPGDWDTETHIAYCEKLEHYFGDVWERQGRHGLTAAHAAWNAIWVSTLRAMRKKPNVYSVLYSTPALREGHPK